VPSFIIIDIRKFEDLPDIDMPENACIAYKIASTSSRIAAFYKNLFLSSEIQVCLLIDVEHEIRRVEFNNAVDFWFY
jgi:hypothetical protein